MTSLTDRLTVATNQSFQSRVAVASVIIAVEVYAEATNIYEHLTRLNYTHNVFGDPLAFMDRFAMAVCATNDDIVDAEIASVGSATDADILDAVRAEWNHVSGVPPQV